MKVRTKLMLASGFLTPMLLFGGVAAVEDNTTTTDDDKVITQQTEETNEDKPTLAERLEARKAALQLRLSFAEQQRLKLRCKGAQGLISPLAGRIQGIETSRTQVHEHLLDRLEKLSERLADRGVDVTTLNTQIDELETKIETFKTDLEEYKQAVADLKDMDCVADPDAFKASLETARNLRAKLKQDVVDIRTYLNDTIKPTLKAIREQLAADNQENEGEGEN